MRGPDRARHPTAPGTARPAPAERAGIEAVAGPGEPGRGGHASRGGHAARGRRDLLLPALHAVQARVGWISQPALNEICRRLTIPPAEAYGVASFYALFSLAPPPPGVAPGWAGRTPWLRSPCLGLCERAPAALVTVAGEEPRTFAIAPATTARVAAELSDAAIDISRADRWPSAPIPQAGDPALRLLARVGRVDPASPDAYRAAGGSEGLGRAFELGLPVV